MLLCNIETLLASTTCKQKRKRLELGWCCLPWTPLNEVKSLFATEADKVRGSSRRVEQSICEALQHVLALCWEDCLSSMNIVRPFLSHTQENERNRQWETTFKFLSIWSRSSRHADGFSKLDTQIGEKQFTIKQLEPERHTSGMSAWLPCCHLESYHGALNCLSLTNILPFWGWFYSKSHTVTQM